MNAYNCTSNVELYLKNETIPCQHFKSNYLPYLQDHPLTTKQLFFKTFFRILNMTAKWQLRLQAKILHFLSTV